MTASLTLDTVAAPSAQAASRGVLNALTVDVEDYFHVSGFDACISRDDWDTLAPRLGPPTEAILDLLARADVRGTFFILGWVAERNPSMVRAIRAAGHEVGSHGHGHRLIYQQSPREFRDDLRASIYALEDCLGEPVRAYRAPSFSITARSQWALDVLIEEGVRIDSSIYPVAHDRYGIPGARAEPHLITRPSGQIWEYPPPVSRIWGVNVPAGGGGYLRLYPYWLTRSLLGRINQEGRPFAAYVHPWELDPEQPRIACGWRQRFRHYVNLHRTEARLRKLCRDFAFGTLSCSLAAYAPAFRERPPGRIAA
jgi:polysaccharide deacetylase family protein (PEP-CTERM system associated)